MKLLIGDPFDRYRTPDFEMRYWGALGDETCGAFLVPRRDMGYHDNASLSVIASCGGGWDHVSVSLKVRCPWWAEMNWIKRCFFKPDEWAIELHPPEDRHINKHPFTLHLWRMQGGSIFVPPPEFV